MATVKFIADVMPNAVSNTSLSSAFQVPGEFSHYMLQMPSITSLCVTTTCAINILVSDSSTGTFTTVAYSSNPATASTGAYDWNTGSASGSKMIICEALMFSPGWAKLQYANTATAAVTVTVYGRKFD
jgi:hypothetical protein